MVNGSFGSQVRQLLLRRKRGHERDQTFSRGYVRVVETTSSTRLQRGPPFNPKTRPHTQPGSPPDCTHQAPRIKMHHYTNSPPSIYSLTASNVAGSQLVTALFNHGQLTIAGAEVDRRHWDKAADRCYNREQHLD